MHRRLSFVATRITALQKRQIAPHRGNGFFSKRNFNQLLKLARHWEVEADRCAKARAYYGACILAADSIGALLLATCDLLPDEVREAASKLEKMYVERRAECEAARLRFEAGVSGQVRQGGGVAYRQLGAAGYLLRLPSRALEAPAHPNVIESPFATARLREWATRGAGH